jgi:putative membrane protein
MMWGFSYGWPMMLWMTFWAIFWLVLLGLAIWGIVRWINRHPASNDTYGRTSASESPAMEILRQRYARGEIDMATFEQMRDRMQATHV